MSGVKRETSDTIENGRPCKLDGSDSADHDRYDVRSGVDAACAISVMYCTNPVQPPVMEATTMSHRFRSSRCLHAVVEISRSAHVMTSGARRAVHRGMSGRVLCKGTR